MSKELKKTSAGIKGSLQVAENQVCDAYQGDNILITKVGTHCVELPVHDLVHVKYFSSHGSVSNPTLFL